MARCWTCGSDLAGGLHHIFTCPLCAQVKETKKIRETLESAGVESLYGATEILSALSDIASIIEWSFEELNWKLEQATDIFRSIDKALKTPGQTQANEWRQIAEELRDRGVLDESEKFFLQSFNVNPLDYRTYIGLGKTYLQMGKFDEARAYWEKSLPHAPKQEFDYRSYSYRLIGRIYFCEDNLQQAAATLQLAIELSPDYSDGHYDYAQYCAQLGQKEKCTSSLIAAIVRDPTLFDLAQKERNFEPLKEEVQEVLTENTKRMIEGMWGGDVKGGKISLPIGGEVCDDIPLGGINNRFYERHWNFLGDITYLWEYALPYDYHFYIDYRPIEGGKVREKKLENLQEIYTRILDYSELSPIVQWLLNPHDKVRDKIKEHLKIHGVFKEK